MTGGTVVDRRAPHKGDLRRAALLSSLTDLLVDGGGDLDSFGVADVSQRAGVTRSAFYFYFENKAAAVAAAGEQLYAEVLDAADALVGEGTPRERVEQMVHALYEAWRRHQHLFRAVLEARATSAPVRETWDAGRAGFVAPVAAMISRERAAGRAPDGVDAAALATVLLDLNERTLEGFCLGTSLPHEDLLRAVTVVWLGALYGRPADDVVGARSHQPAPERTST